MQRSTQFPWITLMLMASGVLCTGTPLAQIPALPGACDPTIQSCIPRPPALPVPPVTCSPSPGGATCSAAGPAVLNAGSGINLGAGNPINVVNGNKYQRAVDMPALPGVLGLELVRHYNSAFSGPHDRNGLVGRGWKLSYETELYASGRTVQIAQADGSRIVFNRDPRDASFCSSQDPAHGTVRVSRTASGYEYRWRWPDGRILTFSPQGKLLQIAVPSGEFLNLQYDLKGLLLRVTDP